MEHRSTLQALALTLTVLSLVLSGCDSADDVPTFHEARVIEAGGSVGIVPLAFEEVEEALYVSDAALFGADELSSWLYFNYIPAVQGDWEFAFLTTQAGEELEDPRALQYFGAAMATAASETYPGREWSDSVVEIRPGDVVVARRVERALPVFVLEVLEQQPLDGPEDVVVVSYRAFY